MEIKDTSLVQLLPGQRGKRMALALVLAGMYCCSAGTVMADENLIITDGTNGPYINDGTQGDHNVDGSLILGDQPDDTGTYTITGELEQVNVTNVNFIDGGNDGNANGALIVGNAGTGIFTQGVGESGVGVDPYHEVKVAGDLVLGSQAGSLGQYTLNTTGSLTVGGKMVVGGASTEDNLFIQNGGTVTVTGSASGDSNYVGLGNSYHTGALFVGGGGDAILDGGTGTYQMNGGTIDTSGIEVGHAGIGVMTQSGDSTVNANDLWLGNAGGSDGSYTLSEGTVNSSWSLGIGMFGTGTFTQEGGTVNSSSVTIGWNNTGTYTQNAGDHNAHEVLLGTDVGGEGFYNLNGGTLSIGDWATDQLVVGHNSQGTFTMTGGEIYINNDDTSINAFVVGNHTGSVGTFIQSGGVVNGGRSLHVGMEGGTGEYNLNTGDSPVLNTGFITLGYSGTGIFNQQAETTNNTGALYIGTDDGTYNQFGGALNDSDTVVGTFGTGEFNQSGGTHTIYNNLIVGSSWGSNGTYTLSGERDEVTLNVGGRIVLGETGNGEFNQSGGTVTTNGLYLGQNGTVPNPTGIYHLTGTGALQVNGDETIGQFGHGEFYQGDGSNQTEHTVTGTLAIGDEANIYHDDDNGRRYGDADYQEGDNSDVIPRSGTYELQDGTLTTNNTIVASKGTGSFLQGGGLHAVTGDLVIGQENLPVDRGCGEGADSTCSVGGPAQGTYTFNGGALTVGGQVIVGDAGTGSFIQTGGTNTVVDTLVLGQEGTANGTYDLNGATSKLIIGDDTLLNGSFEVGSSGIGKFTQHDGSVTVNGLMFVGAAANSQGTYELNGKSLEVFGNEVKIGGYGTGIFTQTGGVFTYAGAMYLGDHETGKGTYYMSGGTLAGGELTLGEWGSTGEFYQSGGRVEVNSIQLARQSSSTGKFELSGAGSQLIVSGSEDIGITGVGTFNQTGGTHEVTGNMNIASGSSANLSGGSLSVASLQNAGTFDFTGGTFKAVTTSTNSGTLAIGKDVIFQGGMTNNVGGILTGSGTVQGNVENSGTLAPGNSPGTFTINGDYTQTGDGTLVAELGGYEKGVTYDWVNINGKATLAGWLDIEIYDSSALDATSADFTLLTAFAGVAGTFDDIKYGAGLLSTEWTLLYSDTDFDTIIDSVILEYRHDNGGGAPVPAPNTLLLFGTGLVGLAGFNRRRKNA